MISTLVLAGALMAPPSSGNLAAAAAASGRPAECSKDARRALGPSVWELARLPELEPYCDKLARAQVQLASNPQAAKDGAAAADKLLPGHAAPAVLLGRAAAALGRIDEAKEHFERATRIDPRSVEEPSTMHELARVLRRSGDQPGALAIYRALVPRIELLPTVDRRVAVLLEAAHLSMAQQRAAAQPNLDEAIAYLREARQRPATQLAGDVVLSLVLVLGRAGDEAQADAALEDARQSGARPRIGASEQYASPEDRVAIEALAEEGSDPQAAAKKWEEFLAGDGGRAAWAGRARARLEALKRGAKAGAGRTSAKGAKGPKAPPAAPLAAPRPKKPKTSPARKTP